MKKMISLLLALAMAFSLAAVRWAHPRWNTRILIEFCMRRTADTLNFINKRCGRKELRCCLQILKI